VRDQPHAIAVCDVDGCEFANLAHWRGERLKLRHMDRSRERKGPQIPSFTSLLGNRHHTKRVNVALRVVAGIAKVPDVHRVVTAIAIETGVGVEESRTNSGTHHDMAVERPVSCCSCIGWSCRGKRSNCDRNKYDFLRGMLP